jgi:uncharacterized protein YggE
MCNDRQVAERKADKSLGKLNLTSNQIYIAAISSLLLALVLALSMVVNRVNNYYPPSVGFSSVGSASITPDGIKLSGVANTLAKSSASGLAEIAKVAESIRQVLAANNVDKKNISSANLSIYPEYSYTPTGVRNLLGYRVTQGFEVVLADGKAAGSVIDQLIGATGDKFQINSISSFVTNLDEVTKSARADAIAKAKLKAEDYAQLTGKRLGKILSINENGSDAPVMPMATSKEALGTSFDMGSTKVEVSLFISWELK